MQRPYPLIRWEKKVALPRRLRGSPYPLITASVLDRFRARNSTAAAVRSSRELFAAGRRSPRPVI